MKELLLWAYGQLKNAGFRTAQLDAEVLLAYVLNKDRVELYLETEKAIDKVKESFYRTLIEKRLAYRPISYITGRKEFMSLDFKVNENVLIPRPETEILVETVCRLGKAHSKILELGTGSGAIAISLAKYKNWHILATDLSVEALLVARENACNHGVIKRVSFLQSDLLQSISSASKFDWVISNPPYIPTQDLASLPDEVKNEPILALDGGMDGLDVIRRIINEAYTVLKPGGHLAIEVGYCQSDDVQKIAYKAGQYSDYSWIKDYSGINRVFVCKARGYING